MSASNLTEVALRKRSGKAERDSARRAAAKAAKASRPMSAKKHRYLEDKKK